jgi:polyhydroxyalkanoate synthesis regulator phasin
MIGIEAVQRQMELLLDQASVASSLFVSEFYSCTSSVYFDLLAHIALDRVRLQLEENTDPMLLQYYNLSSNNTLLEEHVRVLTTGTLFNLWNIFERFIRKIGFDSPKIQDSIEELYKDVIKSLVVKGKITDKEQRIYVGEFDLIRHTRNSLHQGGIYRNERRRQYMLKGKKYILEKER